MSSSLRRRRPRLEWRVLRAPDGYFAGPLYLDDGQHPRGPVRRAGVDAERVATRLDDPDVIAEYDRQRGEARSAAGSPAHAQDKTAILDGLVRFTAPSVVFRRGDETTVAGGWQPLLAYDTLLANFAPELERVPPPDSPEPVLDHFSGGLTTGEVAQLLAHGSDPVPDRPAAASMLESLASNGEVAQLPVGGDVLWRRSS